MAISVTNVAQGFSSSSPSVTSSYTTTSGRLYVVNIFASATSNSYSVSGSNGNVTTWTQISGGYLNPGSGSSSTWYGYATSSGSTTLSITNTTGNNVWWVIDEISNVASSAGVVQQATVASTNTSPASITLSSFASSSNGVYATFWSPNSQTWTTKSGWTTVFNSAIGGAANHILTEYKASNDTNPTGGFSSVQVNGWAAEIAVPPSVNNVVLCTCGF